MTIKFQEKAVCYANGKQWFYGCNSGLDTLLVDGFGNGSTLNGVLMYKDFILNDSSINIDGETITLYVAMEANQFASILQIEKLRGNYNDLHHSIEVGGFC